MPTVLVDSCWTRGRYVGFLLIHIGFALNNSLSWIQMFFLTKTSLSLNKSQMHCTEGPFRIWKQMQMDACGELIETDGGNCKS